MFLKQVRDKVIKNKDFERKMEKHVNPFTADRITVKFHGERSPKNAISGKNYKWDFLSSPLLLDCAVKIEVN